MRYCTGLLALVLAVTGCAGGNESEAPATKDVAARVADLVAASDPARVVLSYSEGAGMGPEESHTFVLFADGRYVAGDGPAWIVAEDGTVSAGLGEGSLVEGALSPADTADLLAAVLATDVEQLPEVIEDQQPIADGSGVRVVVAVDDDGHYGVTAFNERHPALFTIAELVAAVTGWEPTHFAVTP